MNPSNVVKLQHYYFPWELEATLRNFVAYYNNEHYHESLDYVTPADVYVGRQYKVLNEFGYVWRPQRNSNPSGRSRTRPK